jgi:NAD-dependent SIR2 family protein deacetylase
VGRRHRRQRTAWLTGLVQQMSETAIQTAAAAIRDAGALLITAGAGMGVDSGLPDFRGTSGFWQAYPPYEKLGLRFEQLANPALFDDDPQLAWGFYGHRLHLYRRTRPHAGFRQLLDWAAAKPGGCFVFTSNVDGQFTAAGFPADRVVECHGSIHHFQCATPCDDSIWPADVDVEIDEATMRAAGDLPRCPRCGGLSRPNILMFGDGQWLSDRTDAQEARYASWKKATAGMRVGVIECGAGTAIPTVRYESERSARRSGGTLIRINPREPAVPAGHVPLAMPTLVAVEAIAAAIAADWAPGSTR